VGKVETEKSSALCEEEESEFLDISLEGYQE
jgi:hypothetical protein